MLIWRYAHIVAPLVLLAYLVTACVTTGAAPAWLQHPDITMPVRWVRVHGHPQSEVRDGVCVVYLPDAGDQLLTPAEQLLDACWNTGRTRAAQALPEGALLLNWWRVASGLEVARRRQEVKAERGLSIAAAAGFYWQAQRTCNIVTERGQAAAGHELKHCYDGNFHPGTSGQRAPLAPGRGVPNRYLP